MIPTKDDNPQRHDIGQHQCPHGDDIQSCESDARIQKIWDPRVVIEEYCETYGLRDQSLRNESEKGQNFATHPVYLNSMALIQGSQTKHFAVDSP